MSPGIFDGGGKWGGAEAGTVAAALPIKGACTFAGMAAGPVGGCPADTGATGPEPMDVDDSGCRSGGRTSFGGGGFAFGSFGIG